MEVKLIKVPATVGCTGCWYEDRDDECPVKKDEKGKYDFAPCIDSEQDEHMIFIPENQKDEG